MVGEIKKKFPKVVIFLSQGIFIYRNKNNNNLKNRLHDEKNY